MQTVMLTLMRHAKSSWANANQSDHDRPLNKRGNVDAPEMARRLVERGTIPSVILSSSAVRTRETTAHLVSVFATKAAQVHYLNSLYLASPEAILDALEMVENSAHVLLIAHNPGIEDFSAHLQGIFDDTMPTAAVRQFSYPSFGNLRKQLRTPVSDFASAKDNGIELIYSDYPKSTSR